MRQAFCRQAPQQDDEHLALTAFRPNTALL